MTPWGLSFSLLMLLAQSLATPGIIYPATADAIRIIDDIATARLTVSYKDRPILVYAYSAAQYKTYIQELYDFSGYNLLRDAPSDHLHHHGIMYAVTVNGIDFWHEGHNTGKQQSTGVVEKQTGMSESGIVYASFVDMIDWLAPQAKANAMSGSRILQERRTIVISINDTTKEVAVQWTGEFTVDARMKSAVLTGEPYNGLGLRLSKDFDIRVTHRNRERRLDSREGDPNFSKTRWTSASINISQRASTLAVFGDPSNRYGDSIFFSMYEPFAYVSATQGLNKHALDYPAGSSFKLNFLVTVYPELKGFEFLESRSGEWERGKFRPASAAHNRR